MSPEKDSDFNNHEDDSRWEMLSHLFVFQLKLILDGLRDAALIPISVTAGLAGFFLRKDDPWRWYSEVLSWGRATDHWIDLFDAYKNETPPDFDDLVDQTRQRLDDKYKTDDDAEQ